MTAKKLARQKRALERFTILSPELYFARKQGWRDEDATSLGAIVGVALPENKNDYEAYVYRKTVERQALMRRAS